MLEYDPKKRISWEKLYAHEYFQLKPLVIEKMLDMNSDEDD